MVAGCDVAGGDGAGAGGVVEGADPGVFGAGLEDFCGGWGGGCGWEGEGEGEGGGEEGEEEGEGEMHCLRLVWGWRWFVGWIVLLGMQVRIDIVWISKFV